MRTGSTPRGEQPAMDTTPIVDTARQPGQLQVVAAAVAVAGFAHVPPIDHHLAEAPYMAAAFVGFTGACVLMTLLVTAHPDRQVLLAVAALCGTAVLTYAATRLIAFPGLAHDVGRWWEPWGVVAVVAESVALVAALDLVRDVSPSRRAVTA